MRKMVLNVDHHIQLRHGSTATIISPEDSCITGLLSNGEMDQVATVADGMSHDSLPSS